MDSSSESSVSLESLTAIQSSVSEDGYHPNFQWMKDHIGDVLVRGIAETLLLRPEDPIEYLGQWLAQQVRNKQLNQQMLRERAAIQAETDERNKRLEETARLNEMRLSQEQRRKEALVKAQDEAKSKLETEQRNRELELIRAERTENKPPPSFGLPETIVEVPSTVNFPAPDSS